MLKDIILLFLITLIPALELRASIPIGYLQQHHSIWIVAPVCIIANFILGVVWFLFLQWFEHLLEHLGWFHRFWKWFTERAQKKVKPSLDKYGVVGLGIFIGVPLPGTGVYTGALGAYLLGMKFRKFLIGNAIGVLLAGAAVTAVVLLGEPTFGWLFDLFVKAPTP